MSPRPAWLFPAPLRRSRFLASAPEWAQFNVEAALDRIAPFSFAKKEVRPVVWWDFQTQLDNNSRGRLGSGRGGVFHGHYLKGIGRTPAAGNWNDLVDRYHGSGHMSVASALRERLITVLLQARGLGDAIVPCETILLAALRPVERRGAALGHSSSQASLTPADETMLALSVKPACFARMSNFVWALDHYCADPQALGELFLDLERYLNPPDQRENVQGEPLGIAQALDRAFRRGLANFERYNRMGLFWIYTNNNFTLDGRFVDLETPLYFGAPTLGLFEQRLAIPLPYRYLGFESFSFTWYWRLFIGWLRLKLRYLTAPGMQDMAVKQSFLKHLARELRVMFSPAHLLYADDELQKRVVRNLTGPLGLNRSQFKIAAEFARYCFASAMTGRERPLPAIDWRELQDRPAPVSVAPFVIQAPSFLKPELSPDARGFAEALKLLGSQKDPEKLLLRLASEEDSLRRLAG